METQEERIKYTEAENNYYKGVVYRSVNMLEWMMAGPEFHTVAAFDGDELVGSVMCCEVETLVQEKDEESMLPLKSMGYSFPVKLELFSKDIQ
ncbi:hypothetical protein [Paenibacillus sp. OV219]|uniref:hypothetical protein n=1 Tax=Paenibacillus sp. OV219 TaxID=1884377 RepID=UPI0008AE6F77|nr:hypothetical protein [Paenibacillus sp. OV219]SEO04520.1 hypothetical protein SAMN05518847_105336 [Paenibacillus sp. OV219]